MYYQIAAKNIPAANGEKFAEYPTMNILRVYLNFSLTIFKSIGIKHPN
jgi:hypothetical protein